MDGIEEKSQPDFLRWGLITLVVLIGLGIVGGGIFIYQKALKNKKEKPIGAPTPTPTAFLLTEPTQAPEPSPTLELNRAELKIKILNGTGVPGVAAKAASFLEKKGYEGIKTGNADNFDYQKTVIKIKKTKEDYLEQLKADLSENYTLDEETQTLEEEDSFDAIIILGKE